MKKNIFEKKSEFKCDRILKSKNEITYCLCHIDVSFYRLNYKYITLSIIE